MVKHKKEQKETGNLNEVLEEIKQRFGEGAIVKLNETAKVDVDAIPTGSVSLNMALGVNGIPKGRIIEIFGPESTGKSTLALHICAESQKKGGKAAFIDVEHAMDPDYAKRIGVNTDELLIAQPDSGEQALQIVEALARSQEIDVIVVDSVAALTPKTEIAGEIGDVHIGLQARLMSAALRKLSTIASKTKTAIIFINQTRMKIGVMFGCLNYKSKINLENGKTEWIGRIVNQQKKINVLSYDWKKKEIVSMPVISWYNNGPADKFLQIIVYKPYGNGKSQLSCTTNHPILTPTGWRQAQQIKEGDLVMVAVPFKLSAFQLEIIRGSLLGDGNLSETKRSNNSLGIRFRLGHSLKQEKYLKWKASLFKNINSSISYNEKAVKFDLTPLPELYSLRKEIYKNKYKLFSADFIAELTPLSLAVWYMDDGSLDIRNNLKTKARIAICVKRIHPTSRVYLKRILRQRYDIKVKIRKQGDKPIFCFDQENTNKFLNLIKYSIHPSMEYKLLPFYRDKFNVKPMFSNSVLKPIALPVLEIKTKPKTKSMRRFDIRVKKSHNFLADGIIVHNSPETTSGGLALKFYASVRIDLRRIAQIKKGDEIVGSRVKAKVVKNKVAPPFKIAEFDIYYNEGISYITDLINIGIKQEVIKKSGSWLQYNEIKLGQGMDGAKTFLKDNPKIIKEIEKEVLNKKNA